MYSLLKHPGCRLLAACFVIAAGCTHLGDPPELSRPTAPPAIQMPTAKTTTLRIQPQDVGIQNSEEPLVTLEMLIEAVLRSNPELQADLAQYEGRMHRIAQATSLPDPSVQLKIARATGGTMEAMPSPDAGGAPPETRSMGSAVAYTFQVMQPLPWPDKLRLKGELAEQEALIAFESHNVRLLDTIHELQQFYYELAFAYASLALLRDEKHYLDQYLETAAVGYAVGRHGRQALLKAQTEAVQIDNEILAFPGRIESLRSGLRARIGAIAGDETDLSRGRILPLDRIVVALPDIAPDELLEQAMDLLPESVQLDRQIEVGRLSLALARQDYRPDFTIGLEYMNSAASAMSASASGRRNTVGVMAGFTVPVPNARRRAQLAEARLLEREAQLRKRALEVNTAAALEGAFERLYSLADQVLVYEDSLIPLALETYETSRAEYETGMGDYLDLLDALRTLIGLRREELQLKRDALMLLADIQRITGARFVFEEYPTRNAADTGPSEDSDHE